MSGDGFHRCSTWIDAASEANVRRRAGSGLDFSNLAEVAQFDNADLGRPNSENLAPTPFPL